MHTYLYILFFSVLPLPSACLSPLLGERKKTKRREDTVKAGPDAQEPGAAEMEARGKHSFAVIKKLHWRRGRPGSSVGRGACCQARSLSLPPRAHDGGRKPTPASCPLTSRHTGAHAAHPASPKSCIGRLREGRPFTEC